MKFIMYDGPYGNLMIDKTLFMDQINYIRMNFNNMDQIELPN